jgi:hypothetical protein
MENKKFDLEDRCVKFACMSLNGMKWQTKN